MPNPQIDTKQVLNWLDHLRQERTENFCQNGEILGNQRRAREYLVKAQSHLNLDHPAYSFVFAAYGCVNSSFKSEESEDLRHKGFDGITERTEPLIRALIEFYETHKNNA
jgi:hypothetical protein